MELALFVYLAGVVGNVGFLFSLCTLSGLIGLIVYLIVVWQAVDVYNRKFSDFKGSLTKCTLTVFCAAILSSAVPSEKTMYLMLAGYTAQQVVQSDTGDKIVKVINAKLDEYIEEATKGKEKK